jgi:hypothetical protein
MTTANLNPVEQLKAPIVVGSGELFGLCPSCNHDFAKTTARQKYCSDKCRQKNFYHGFKATNGVRYKKFKALQPKPRYKIGSRTRLAAGVSSDGHTYLTNITVGTVHKRKTYSIEKLGEKGARMAAALQRMAWVIELGVWNPKDGDPFQILSYTDMFKGNEEYEDAVLDRRELSSPHLYERETEES